MSDKIIVLQDDGTQKAAVVLGTAASKDVPASGDASTAQVVKGDDSRLTNSRPASDVYAWAKASTKPSYTYTEVGAAAASHSHVESDVTNLTTDLAGKVAGPSSATSGNMAVFDGATGKLVKDGGTPARGLDVNVQSLTGDLTLTADSPRVQVLNPNGADRTITLPSPTAGLEFYIVNAGAYNSTKSLLIALSNVHPQTMLHCIGDGTNWIVEIISGWNDGNGYNVAVGKNTSVYSYGTAVGCQANGFTSGAAVGCQANGNTYGAALGYGATGNSYGAAVGYNAISNSKLYTIALGAYARCLRYGECVINGDQSSRKAASYLDHWTGQTTDATQRELYLKGIASNRCVLQAQSSILFSLSVVARDDTNNKSKAWEVKGVIQRDNASATALVGSVTKTIVADSGVAWDVTVDADDTNESLRVQVTGAASTTIRWYVAGRLTEVVA